MKLGIPLKDLEQLAEINAISNKPRVNGVLIFKHSTRCSVSYFAYKKLQAEWNFSQDELPLYYLDLLAYRRISDQIAVNYGVKHESPQILFIKNGRCVGNASHSDVSVVTVENWMNE